ncbi:MAG: protein jag [Oscillospiraceae bacterium]|jgi:spoIIIJ-associated protein|nr:protein jag [Oscillospiraceae bacterium]
MPVKEIIETGKTVDAAIDSACEKLGCQREDCEWEIIDLPKKGFLGLKNVPAKVRVAIDIPEEKSAAPVQAVSAAKAPAAPAAAKQPAAPAGQISGEAKVQEKNRNDKPAGVINQDKILLAKNYIGDILQKMGLDAQMIVSEEEGGVCINIDGKGLGAIIGRRGETLDAIQYLTSLVANRIDGDYMRITIDCGDYRMKRKETLETLARKLASQVLKTNISRTLEPMNPFERRIIHATVSEIEGVSSISTGEEPNRRVVITSPTAKSRSGRGNNALRGRGPRSDSRDGGRGGYGGGGRPQRSHGGRDGRDSRSGSGTQRPDTRPPASSQASRTDAPKKTPEAEVSNDKPLYTKIDLE